MVRCKLLYTGRTSGFGILPVPICSEPSRTGSHNPSWPETGSIYSLQILQRKTWYLFQDLSASGVPCLGPWNTMDILLLTYWGIHSFCCKNSDHMRFKLCPQNIAVQINVAFIPLFCIKQYLLRSLFWWNGRSLNRTGNHLRSSSHKGSEFPDKRYSSGLIKMNSVMQYPLKEQTADLQEIPLPALTDLQQHFSFRGDSTVQTRGQG